MTYAEITAAMYNIREEMSPEMVVLFGGEPTIRKDLPDIINFMHEIKQPYCLISNSVNSYPMEGLKNYTASIDYLRSNGLQVSGSIETKSFFGLGSLIKAKKDGVPDVVGNIIITSKNWMIVPDIVKTLDRYNIWSIIGLVHSGKEPFWLFRSDTPKLQPTLSQIKYVSEELFHLKQRGFKIHNDIEYFKMMPKYYKLNWKCGDNLQYVTIDVDGSFMSCPDWDRLEGYNILTYNRKDFKQLEIDWKESVKECPGCYYNHMLQLSLEGEILHES